MDSSTKCSRNRDTLTFVRACCADQPAQEFPIRQCEEVADLWKKPKSQTAESLLVKVGSPGTNANSAAAGAALQLRP